jgi:hypothetical protein
LISAAMPIDMSAQLSTRGKGGAPMTEQDLTDAPPTVSSPPVKTDLALPQRQTPTAAAP